MATLQERLIGLMDAIFADTGDVSALTTTASNLAAAINEVKATADAAGGGTASVNDSVTNLVDVWSSQKVSNEITAAIVAALEGEDLSDLAAEITALAAADVNLASAASVSTLEATVNNKANLSDVYTRTELGDPNTDLAAYWNGL